LTDVASQFDVVVDLFVRLGVPVRREKLGGSGGGLCVVRGERVLFIDSDADVGTQLERCLAALATIPEVDEIYLVPSLRDRVEAFKTSLS